MNILIDIGHPAHVHYFKNLCNYFLAKNNKVLFTFRDKEVVKELLNFYQYKGINFGKSFKSRPGKIWGLILFTIKELFVALRFKPDILLNSTMYSAIVAKMIGKPHISLEDTFNMEQIKIYLPFTSVVLTGDYDHPDLGKKEVRYSGYQELAYLHPNNFIPDRNVLSELGLKEKDSYVILRFGAWQASHDYGHKGISYKNKIKIIREFEKYAKVFISSEAKLSTEFLKYKINIAPEKMHDAIAFANLVLGECFTMLSEAAVLGVPAILIHNNKSYYLEDQEKKYGLVFNYSETEEDQEKAIQKGIEVLRTEGIQSEWQCRRQKMLSVKIDVSAFMVWFVENYPVSYQKLKSHPDYQCNFQYNKEKICKCI